MHKEFNVLVDNETFLEYYKSDRNIIVINFRGRNIEINLVPK